KRIDEVSIDPMGNVVAKLGSGSRSIMIGVHMDETCLVVKYIDPRGYLYFRTFLIHGWSRAKQPQGWLRSAPHHERFLLPLNTDYLKPSSFFASSFFRPPIRGWGRPESVTTMTTTISSDRGAS